MRIFTLFIIIIPIALFGQTTLLEEDFNGGVLQNQWYKGFDVGGGGNAMQVASKPGNPSGDNWVGSLSTFRVVDTAGVAQTWAGDVSWTNYEVETQLYIPATGGSPFSFVEYYALEFRVDTSGNTAAYQFMATFNPNSVLSPRLRFRKRPIENPAQPVTIREWLAAEIPGGVPTTDGWHKFKVKAEGNQFWFYFNDVEMPGCPYSDTLTTQLLNNGPIGIYAFRMNFMGNPLDTTVIYADDIEVTSIVSGLSENENQNLLKDYSLAQNYPNPFNPVTTIEFRLERTNTIKLEVFNLNGEFINTIAEGVLSAGNYKYSWNGTDLKGNIVAGGVYLYKLTTKEGTISRKMTFLK